MWRWEPHITIWHLGPSKIKNKLCAYGEYCNKHLQCNSGHIHFLQVTKAALVILSIQTYCFTAAKKNQHCSSSWKILKAYTQKTQQQQKNLNLPGRALTSKKGNTIKTNLALSFKCINQKYLLQPLHRRNIVQYSSAHDNTWKIWLLMDSAIGIIAHSQTVSSVCWQPSLPTQQQVRASTNHGTGDCTVSILLNTNSKEKLNVGHKNHTVNRKIRRDNKKD